MSPLRAMNRDQRDDDFGLHPNVTPLAQTSIVAANNMRLLIVLLGSITLCFIFIWFLARVRLRWTRRHTLNHIPFNGEDECNYSSKQSTIEVFESDISIDMIGEDWNAYDSGTEFEDLTELDDMETILSSASATRMSFRLETLPSIIRGGILERRGRNNIYCDTSAYYDSDVIASDTGPLTGHTETKRSVTRPVFGFNFHNITPPIGNALWSRNITLPRAIVPGALTHPVFV